MDTRLYILAGTFALMVLSVITVVIVFVRASRRDKPVSLHNLPPVPPPSIDTLRPIDADLRGLDVPVPEDSPHAALLKPLADKPVWGETTRPSSGATSESRDDVASSAPAAEPEAVNEPEPTATAAPAVPAAAVESAEREWPEGPGRIPQIGDREVHRLPSAEEILASLEAEMARQEREEPATPDREAAAVVTTEQASPSALVDGSRPAAEATEPAAPVRTTSAAGLPVEQTQWKPLAPSVAEATVAAPVAAAVEPAPAIPRPLAPVAPVAGAAQERPAAVVRTVEPPAAPPATVPPATAHAPRPAVRVAGIRVPLQESGRSGASAGEPANGEDVPQIELSSPVEMWFGEHRVGVKQGTATFDRMQRYADTLLGDLRSSRENA